VQLVSVYEKQIKDLQAEVKTKDSQLQDLRLSAHKDPKTSLPLRTMNSPNRLPVLSSARDPLMDSLETQLKTVTAERDLCTSKISQLERHFNETQASSTNNVSAFRDTFITGALEYLAYFLRYSIRVTYRFSIKDERSAQAVKELLHPGSGSLHSELPSQRTAVLLDQARTGLKPSIIAQFNALTLHKSNCHQLISIVKSLHTDTESFRQDCDRLRREHSDQATLVRDL
jgi:hypothetical protein